MTRLKFWIAAASIATIVATAVSASAPQRQSQTDLALANGFELGRPPGGEPCSLVFRWEDRRKGNAGAGSGVDRNYTINCRGPAASRVVGTVTVTLVRDKEHVSWTPPADPNCGAAQQVRFGEIDAWAQLCGDEALGPDTVRLQFEKKGKIYRGDADFFVRGPLEVALYALATETLPAKDAKEASSRLDWERLAKRSEGLSGGAAKPVVAEPFNADVLLRGARLNQQGLYVQASLVLNDAFSRLPRDASPALRSALMLEAALADSNSGKSHLADRKFAEVNLQDLTGEGAALIGRKYRLYSAFAWLNKEEPQKALDALMDSPKTTDASTMPLLDEASLRETNRFAARGDGAVRAIAAQEVQRREWMMLDLQEARVRSVAHYKLGQYSEARAALVGGARVCKAAVDSQFAQVAANGDPAAVGWLRAASLRQCARLDFRQNKRDLAEQDAVAAIEALTQSSVASGADLGQPVAETNVELANYYLANSKPDLATARFRDAVDSMAAATDPLSTPLPGIDTYLDLLMKRSKAGDKDAADDFFKAVQVIGTPAVARQTAEIEQIVTADPAIGRLYRDRRDQEREVRRLSYAINQLTLAGARSDAKALTDLRAERAVAEQEAGRLTGLLGKSRIGAVNNSPVKIKEVTDLLDPGEVYFKLTSIPGGKTYGILIAHGKVKIYACQQPTDDLMRTAEVIRKSASGRQGFQVGMTYAFFVALAGDAAGDIASANAVVVDGQGPLQVIPAGILVTSADSVVAYGRKLSAKQGSDYSDVAFLAKRARLSTALSPRSFLLTREMPPALQSDPDHPLKAFLGVGAPATPSPALAELATKRFDTACTPGGDTVGAIFNRTIWHLDPIDTADITIAARALGVPDADTQTGASFTDTAFKGRDDLDQYMVIHFATHGLPEQRISCADVPPALVTSIDATATDSDGLLSYEEVAQLKLNANLVVLAACETYTGLSEERAEASGQESGTTLEGLTRAFLAAQARSVLATYWRVPVGRVTDNLMDVFYVNGRTGTIGDALRAAQRHLIASKEFSHPFYWGAYFLVGDSRHRMLESRPAARGPVGG